MSMKRHMTIPSVRTAPKDLTEYVNRKAKDLPKKHPKLWRELNRNPIDYWIKALKPNDHDTRSTRAREKGRSRRR